MTMLEARAALNLIPAHLRNNNCVQDAQWRLRAALGLAGDVRFAPAYVIKAVDDLASWIER